MVSLLYTRPKTLPGVLALAAAVVGAGWIAVKFVLPAAAPFAAALAIAAVMEPAVRFLCRRGLKREAASGACTLALLALLAGGVYALATHGARLARSLAAEAPELLSRASRTVERLLERMESAAPDVPPELENWAGAALSALATSVAELPAWASSHIVSALSSAAAGAPGLLLFAISCGVGVYFISASLPDIQSALDRRLPESWQRRRRRLWEGLRFTVGRYLRAQVVMAAITFAEVLPGLWLLGVERAALISLAIAVIDALPVFGAGAVLIPWAAAALLLGDTPLGLGLLILWGVVTLVRNCVQAKLLGDQLGLHPLVTLMAIYAGWRLASVAGMVLFPMAALLVQQCLPALRRAD